ncbi:Nucleotide-binding alpha-beta plait domain containing protein [Parasponia andersonii]|uniref:Nucleotide-binding alpha-beta plait domain containing protein n=1 Tax=Parasponia andersonii TaxID=3476 RepID=A0A2P5DLB7_PARAD|nr:Nucleotide-binding alpha-beta plait domain containing protein [Parasponia andersonii]
MAVAEDEEGEEAASSMCRMLGPRLASRGSGLFSRYSRRLRMIHGVYTLEKATGKSIGYALIVYKSVEGLKKALEKLIKLFEGFKLQCSMATKVMLQRIKLRQWQFPRVVRHWLRPTLQY